MSILNKLWDFLGKLFSKNDTINSISNSQISVHGGSFIQANATFDLSTKESAEETGKQIIKILQDYYLVDVHNDKFKFYLNQSILILKLNDSQTKRKVLIELLAKKFTGKDIVSDDSDTPTTIALDAMRYLTDVTLKRLCVHRLITNILPSIISDNKNHLQTTICDFVDKNGFLSDTEIMNLRRLGVMFDMNTKAYSYDEIHEYLYPLELGNTKDSLFWSSCLSPAGIELTNITLDYFLHINGSFDQWLPMHNKSLHLKELTVDEDVMVMKNLIANGEVSAGGIGEENL